MDSRTDPPRPDDHDDGPNRGPVVALAAIIVLAIIGWLVIRGLQDNSKMQDCLLEGRHDCAPIEGAPPLQQ
jgi:hypothetical protein